MHIFDYLATLYGMTAAVNCLSHCIVRGYLLLLLFSNSSMRHFTEEEIQSREFYCG